jgi:hypothetical protein
MQNGRSIKVLWWNERKEFAVTLCTQMFMDKVPVAETKMPIASEELGLSTFDMSQLG